MPWILDTDHLSILQQRSQPGFDRLRVRLNEVPPDEMAVTLISFQEQVQGWLAYLNQARKASGVLHAYDELTKLLQYYCEANVLPFGQSAQDRFADLRNTGVRIGTMDLRIASIALTTDSTLLSRNRRDFGKVPGLLVEDWTR